MILAKIGLARMLKVQKEPWGAGSLSGGDKEFGEAGGGDDGTV